MRTLKQVYWAVIAAALLATLSACSPSIHGGPCTYSDHAGTATITDVKLREDAPQGQGPRGEEYWVEFATNLTGAQPTQSFYRNEGNRFLISNPQGKTDLEWLAAQGISVDAKLDVKVSVIKSGTCTPVIFKFPTLPEGAVKD